MNAYLSPMQVALHPAFDLGRGARRHHSQWGETSWGVFTQQAPFENLCAPGEVVGPDGRCRPKPSMGQAAPATPARGGAGGFSTHKTVGLAAAAVGLGAGATQIFSKNEKMKKVAFWAEMGAIAVLGAIVVGIPGMMGGGKPPAQTTTGST